jgi:hypothetical protein
VEMRSEKLSVRPKVVSQVKTASHTPFGFGTQPVGDSLSMEAMLNEGFGTSTAVAADTNEANRIRMNIFLYM